VTCLLNVVLAPERTTAVLTPGFRPDPSLNLRYFGGRTLPDLTWTHVYLAGWDAKAREHLDHALAAAMSDTGLNNVLAQYFPDADVTARFAGSRTIRNAPTTIDQPGVEKLVAQQDVKGAVVLLLPPGTVLRHGATTSKQGLGGFHGSVHLDGRTVYYAVAVYSEGSNGIVEFREPWQNVCATVYHELQEIRTDPDVEDAIRAGDGEQFLGWYSPRGGEIGDIAIVMRTVPLADGSGTVPVQLMWSNAVAGPEGPISRPHPPQ
jgi:hypothetical protein